MLPCNPFQPQRWHCATVWYLWQELHNLKYRKAYLSAVQFLHIGEGFGVPFLPSLQRLQYTLLEIKRCKAEKGEIKRRDSQWTLSYCDGLRWYGTRRIQTMTIKCFGEHVLLASLVFWGLGSLQCQRIALLIQRPISVLCSNIAVENSSLPQVIRITIKQSKTGPFRNRVSLFLGRTSVDLCPVESLLDNLVVRGSKDGRLFIFKDGRPLTRQCLVTVLREVLQVCRNGSVKI